MLDMTQWPAWLVALRNVADIVLVVTVVVLWRGQA